MIGTALAAMSRAGDEGPEVAFDAGRTTQFVHAVKPEPHNEVPQAQSAHSTAPGTALPAPSPRSTPSYR